MSGTWKSDKGFVSAAHIKDFPAYVAGHKTVILAVEQQDTRMAI